MGIAVGDLDGKGRPDIVVTNFAGEPKTLYRNVEGALFDDATEASGVERPSLPYVQWGTDIVDLDDDGRPDLVMVSGHLIPKMIMSMARLFGNSRSLGPYAHGDRSYKQPPVLYRNAGGGRMEDATPSSGDLAGLRLSARGLAAGDVDGDGRVDLVIASIIGGAHVLRNATAAPGTRPRNPARGGSRPAHGARDEGRRDGRGRAAGAGVHPAAVVRLRGVDPAPLRPRRGGDGDGRGHPARARPSPPRGSRTSPRAASTC